MINSTERSDILVFNCYLCHVSCFACFLFNSTKLGEILSKCFEDFVAQALGFLIRFCSAELREFSYPPFLRITSFYRPFRRICGNMLNLFLPMNFRVFLLELFKEKFFAIEHILHNTVLSLQQPQEIVFYPVDYLGRGSMRMPPDDFSF